MYALNMLGSVYTEIFAPLMAFHRKDTYMQYLPCDGGHPKEQNSVTCVLQRSRKPSGKAALSTRPQTSNRPLARLCDERITDRKSPTQRKTIFGVSHF